MSKDPIKDALRMMHYGFYSITSRYADDVNIMVANWVSQVSFEPRLLALGLQKTSYTHGLVEKGKVFAVNIFAEEDEDAIKEFTKGREKDPDKVKNARYSAGPETGCPILDDAAAYIEVKVTDIFDIGGDHDVVVGEVVGAGVRQELDPDDVLSLSDLGWSYAG
jgi:flavin reductase (DIM6/NTAB) family NADH-FMN oxidoreductase RutF